MLPRNYEYNFLNCIYILNCERLQVVCIIRVKGRNFNLLTSRKALQGVLQRKVGCPFQVFHFDFGWILNEFYGPSLFVIRQDGLMGLRGFFL